MAERNPFIPSERRQDMEGKAKAEGGEQDAQRRYQEQGRAKIGDSPGTHKEPTEATPVDVSDAPEQEGSAANSGPSPINGAQSNPGKSASG
jgi:hypothetical protein